MLIDPNHQEPTYPNDKAKRIEALGSASDLPGAYIDGPPPYDPTVSTIADNRQAGGSGVKLLLWQGPSLTATAIYSTECPDNQSVSALVGGFKPSKAHPLPAIPSSAPSYILSTRKIERDGLTDQHLLTSLTIPGSSAPLAMMSWHEMTVEIAGRKSIVYGEMFRYPGAKVGNAEQSGVEERIPGQKGVFSNNRIWHWAGEKFLIEHDASAGTWTASRYDPSITSDHHQQTPSSSSPPLLTLSPLQKRTFKKDVLPFVTLHDSTLDMHTRAILLVACIWQEIALDIRDTAPKAPFAQNADESIFGTIGTYDKKGLSGMGGLGMATGVGRGPPLPWGPRQTPVYSAAKSLT